jgi:dihydroxyacid dehydratase/phosphogluconate dehydratase
MGHAFDLKALRAAIKQQAEPQAGRCQIIGTLNLMRVVHWFDGLQLEQARR